MYTTNNNTNYPQQPYQQPYRQPHQQPYQQPYPQQQNQIINYQATNTAPQETPHVSDSQQPETPFPHLQHLPVFEIYSLNEVRLLWNSIQQNMETKRLRGEVVANMPPPPSTADVVTFKMLSHYLSAMGDGGMSIAAAHINIDNMLNQTLKLMDKMEQTGMKDTDRIVYSRWTTPVGVTPAALVDVLAWHRIKRPDKITYVQVKANTTELIKINEEKGKSIKEGKGWLKVWWRAQDNLKVSLIVGGKAGKQVELEQVLSLERNISSVVLPDFAKRWKKFRVPKQ